MLLLLTVGKIMELGCPSVTQRFVDKSFQIFTAGVAQTTVFWALHIVDVKPKIRYSEIL